MNTLTIDWVNLNLGNAWIEQSASLKLQRPIAIRKANNILKDISFYALEFGLPWI